MSEIPQPLSRFKECPYCRHFLHFDYFPPDKACWGNRGQSACYDCEDEYNEYIKTRERCRRRNYSKERRQTDIGFKLASNLRVRVNIALHGKTKVGSAVKDLGCTSEQLVTHLESLFEPGMSRDNHGNKAGQWSVDHIMPLTAFNLEDRQHFILAAHYLNLQPMWHVENIRKGGANRL